MRSSARAHTCTRSVEQSAVTSSHAGRQAGKGSAYAHARLHISMWHTCARQSPGQSSHAGWLPLQQLIIASEPIFLQRSHFNYFWFMIIIS